MKSNIYISVIIPVYNRRKQLEHCLSSIAKNTLSQDKYEVIVVDDCSTDDTQEFIKNYKGISNYRYILRDTNSGTASVPRNEGIQKAIGQYIYFIDSDDYIIESTLEDGLSFALENNSDIVCLPFFSEPNLRKVAVSMYKSTNKNVDLESSSLIRNLSTINKLINREIIIKNKIIFPAHIRHAEDNLFTIQCYAAAQKISILAEKKYYYLSPQGDDNLTNIPIDMNDIVYIISEGCKFILKTSVDMSKKLNILTLFINRMLNGTFKNLNQDSLQHLYALEKEYGIFSQIANNQLLTKPYIVHGILRNNINYIKTLDNYAVNKNFNGKVKIKDRKPYLEYINKNTLEYIDISYINPIDVYITSITYDNFIMHVEFYVFDSFFPDENHNVSLLCMERKNREKCLHFDAFPIENHKNKYIANIDLSFICLYLTNTIDIYICTNYMGFSTQTRLGKNKITLKNNQIILPTTEEILINDKPYQTTSYETQGGYLAISLSQKTAEEKK